jgi:hypothetical protein
MKIIIFWDETPCSPLKVTDISEEHTASIFRIEEQTQQEISVKAADKQGLLVIIMQYK